MDLTLPSSFLVNLASKKGIPLFLHLPWWRQCYPWSLLYSYVVAIILPSCVNQADDVVHTSLPASRVTVLWCCGDDILLQIRHVQVHNNGVYWAAQCYWETLLVNFRSNSEVRCPQYKYQQLHGGVYTQVGSLLQCCVFLQSFPDDLTRFFYWSLREQRHNIVWHERFFFSYSYLCHFFHQFPLICCMVFCFSNKVVVLCQRATSDESLYR